MIRDDSYEMNESNESCIANVSNDAVCGNDRSDFARIGVLWLLQMTTLHCLCDTLCMTEVSWYIPWQEKIR
jgi:hypothetical protein